MPVLFRIPYVIKLFLIFSFVLIISDRSSAIEIEAYAGFDGICKSYKISPIIVKLTNTGSDQIIGELQAIPGTDTYQDLGFSSMCKVNLPPNSVKKYRIYLRPDNYGDIIVKLQSGIQTVAMKKIEFKYLSPNAKLIVSIGMPTDKIIAIDDKNIDEYIMESDAGNPPIPANQNARTESVVAGPDLLPDRPSGYEGVDLLVMADPNISAIGKRELDAIGMWVASGGTFVICGGPDYRIFQNDFYRDMLPVDVTGLSSVSSSEILSEMGKLPFRTDSMAVMTSVPKNIKNSAFKKENGIPIISKRRYGAGQIIFLAFDPLSQQFRNWQGQDKFWMNMLTSAYPEKLIESGDNLYNEEDYYSYNQNSQSSNTKRFSYVVESLPAVKMPSFGLIIGFLLIYLIVLVPVNYIFMKNRRILEKAWYSTLIIVAAFTLLAYGIGYFMRGGKLQMQEANLMQVSEGEKYAAVMTSASVFSPARRTYNLIFDDPYSVIESAELRSAKAKPVISLDDTAAICDLRMSMWSSRSLKSISGRKLPGSIVSDIRVIGNRVHGKITNKTGFDLSECRMLYLFSIADIPAIPNGKTVELDIELNKEPFNFNVAKDDNMPHRIDAFIDQSLVNSNRLVLIGSYDNNNGKLSIDKKNGVIQSANRIVVSLDAEYLESNYLPLGSIEGKVLKQTGSYSPVPGNNQMSTDVSLSFSSGYSIVLFRIDPSVVNSLSSLIINTEITNQNSYRQNKRSKPVLTVYNTKTKKWDALAIGSGIKVSECKSYIDNKNEVRIKAEIKDKESYDYYNMTISVTGTR